MTTIRVDSHDIDLSNLDKVFFPDSGITKGDVVDYYRRIAGTMLTHLHGRPLVMQRFPDGIDGDGFIQKQAPDYFPDWIATVELPKEDGSVRHVVVDSPATIAYLANQGCISFHALLSRAERPEHPAELVFDLDPPDGDDGAGAEVAFAAREIHHLLTELRVSGYAKSSGSRGIHVHVPLDGQATFDEARDFSQAVGDLLASRHPDRLTTAQRKTDRQGRLFIDTLRNAYAQHAVAPYSLRARPGAPVAIPLDWDEATSPSFDPQRITLANVFRRVVQKDDPWAEMPQAAASLPEVARKLSRKA